jgi:hypothetical protein
MRTKEAIATVRGFCKHQARGPEGDPFAKGILAALRWMTEKESPCPYAELEEDLPDDGGWEEYQYRLIAPATQVAPPAYREMQGMASPPTMESLPSHQPTHLYDPSNPPPPDQAPSLVLPDSMSSHLAQHPWLKQYVDEISDLHRSHGGAPMQDNNSVIVGSGLRDSPVLGGEGDYDE